MRDDQDLPQHLEDDRRCLEALRAAGFRGPPWDRFAEGLAEYGFQVIVAWIETGQIFERMQERQRQLRLSPPSDGRSLTGEVAEELAVETVGCAIPSFRKVLRREGWSAARGASLSTFFIGQCLFSFPNVYRRWLGETRPPPWSELQILEDLIEGDYRYDQGQWADPAEHVGDQDDLQAAARQLQEQLGARMLFILRKRDEGYTQAEIADMLGVTRKTVEHLIAKLRRWQQGEGGIV